MFCFLVLLRLGNSAWDIFKGNFWSRDFLGVLLEAVGVSFAVGFDFCSHSIITVT